VAERGEAIVRTVNSFNPRTGRSIPPPPAQENIKGTRMMSDAQEKGAVMEWTKKFPTQIGFYWCYHKKRIVMMEIYQTVTGLFMKTSNNNTGSGVPVPEFAEIDIKYSVTQWYGPLPVPEPPK
jgi:hypothetical protein